MQHNIRFLQEILQNRKSETLEWLVIILIGIEVLISIYDIVRQSKITSLWREATTKTDLDWMFQSIALTQHKILWVAQFICFPFKLNCEAIGFFFLFSRIISLDVNQWSFEICTGKNSISLWRNGIKRKRQCDFFGLLISVLLFLYLELQMFSLLNVK